MITTYGVYGKVELVIALTIGVKSIPVNFEGGNVSSRGVVPATYKTNSPIIQKGIETSPEYKCGIIKKLTSVPEESDMINARKMKEAREKAEAEALAKQAEEKAKTEEAARKAQIKNENHASNEKEAETAPTPAVEPVAPAVEEQTAAEEATADASTEAEAENPAPATSEQKKEVQVTCMEDAVEYLKNNYEGYTSSKLRSKAAVERAAAENGIVFVGL